MSSERLEHTPAVGTAGRLVATVVLILSPLWLPVSQGAPPPDVFDADNAEGQMLEQGDLDRAIQHRVDLVEKARKKKDYARVHLHLRFLMQLQGAVGDWESVLQSALEMERTRSRPGGQGIPDAMEYLFLAEASRRLGDYEKAIAYADQAQTKRQQFLKSLAAKTPLDPAERTTLEVGALQAYCLHMLGRDDEARKAYQRHRRVVLKVPRDSEPVLYLMGFEPTDLLYRDVEVLEFKASLAKDFCFALGRQAVQTLREAGKTFANASVPKEVKDQQNRLEAHMAAVVPRWERDVRSMAPWYAGMAALFRSDPQAARRFFEPWLEDPAHRSNANAYWLASDRLGACLEKTGDAQAGIARYRAAVDVLEQQRSFLSKDDHRRRFLLGRDHPYDRLVLLLSGQGQAPAAFEIAERAKARAMLDLLASRRMGRTSEAQGGFESIVRLSRRSTAAEEGRVVTGATGLPQEINYQAIRERNTRELDKTFARFEQTDPELSSMIHSRSLGYSQVARALPPGAVLVEFYLTDEGGCVFRGDGTSVTVNPIAQPEKELRKMVQTLRERILSGEPGFETLSRSLYDLLLRRVLGDRPPSHIYIVPHGPLHYLPFAALHDGKQYLIERSALAVLPSASALPFCVDKRRTRWNTLVALGNPKLPQPGFDLPSAEREVAAVAPLFRKKSVWVREAATESTLIKHIGKADVVHLACHAHFDPQWPNQSGLLLAPDKSHDGYLRAAEFFALSLNASLVTLSACETGLGGLSEGDDVVGLCRAILYAGSPSVLSTLWAVDDAATSDFMVAFYKTLRSGRGKAVAVQEAQWAMLHRSGQATVHRGTVLARPGERPRPVSYAHPFFWAPFVVIGDGE